MTVPVPILNIDRSLPRNMKKDSDLKENPKIDIALVPP